MSLVSFAVIPSPRLLAGEPAIDQAAGAVEWRNDGYQLGLWKLYEINSWNSQYESTHIWELRSGTPKWMSQPHELRLEIDVDRETKAISFIEPMLRFEFPGPVSSGMLKEMYHDNESSFLFRFVRLPDFCEEVVHSRGVVYIEATYTHLDSIDSPWYCNGYYIDAGLATSGTYPRIATYVVGSGLDPFIEGPPGRIAGDGYSPFAETGEGQGATFKPRNVLIDPIMGPLKEETSGAKVFAKWSQ
jgi:hypothetical protein